MKIENQIKNRQIEAAITQRCMDFKDNQKKMISSLTDNHKNSIHIDRIMVEQKDKEEFIFIDPAKIKLQVEKYYLQAFKKRNSNFQQLSEDWKKQYESRFGLVQKTY